MAGDVSVRTTGHYDRRNDSVALDEVGELPVELLSECRHLLHGNEAVAWNILELLHRSIRPPDFNRAGVIGFSKSEIQAWILCREVSARRNHGFDHPQTVGLYRAADVGESR